MRSGLTLCRNPHVAAVGSNVRRAVHRFHAGVSQERDLEHALEGSCVALQGGRRVAVVARDLAGLLRKRRIFLHDLDAAQIRQ